MCLVLAAATVRYNLSRMGEMMEVVWLFGSDMNNHLGGPSPHAKSPQQNELARQTKKLGR